MLQVPEVSFGLITEADVGGGEQSKGLSGYWRDIQPHPERNLRWTGGKTGTATLLWLFADSEWVSRGSRQVDHDEIETRANRRRGRSAGVPRAKG